MNDDKQIAPEVQTSENASTDQQTVDQDQPQKEENLITIPADKLIDYKRKLTGSKEEAMRLKAEKERLEAELESLKNPQELAQYSQQDVDDLRRLAKLAGIPLKEDQEKQQREVYEQEKQEAVKAFLEKHPEYTAIGDIRSDEMWESLEGEISMYVQPQKGKDYLTLLEKAHRQIHYDPTIERERGKALGMAQAKLQEQTTIGGSSAKTSASSKKVPQAKQDIMAGFAAVRPEAFTS